MNAFFLGGERCDPDSVKWVHKTVPSAYIVDSWWQTETSWPIVANAVNIEKCGLPFPTLPGSVTKPMFGWNLKIFDDENRECEPGQLGKVVIK